MTPEVFVKVCGITRPEDAARAVAVGARAIGFVLWPRSPRHISLADAAGIARTLPQGVLRVGVFVDAGPDEVREAVAVAGLDVVQLHGDEDVGQFSRVGATIVKALTLTDSHAVERAVGLPASVTVLVDAHDGERRGGTGRRADWTLAAAVAARRPLWLAGGLGPDNVAAAIQAVRPAAVDVSSGVESAPGIKDHARLAAFMAAVRGAEMEAR